jgi:hypothetical protein
MMAAMISEAFIGWASAGASGWIPMQIMCRFDPCAGRSNKQKKYCFYHGFLRVSQLELNSVDSLF